MCNTIIRNCCLILIGFILYSGFSSIDGDYLADDADTGINKNTEVIGYPILHDLGNGAYGITGLYHTNPRGSVNAGIIVTDNSIIVIDSGMTVASGKYILESARKIKPDFKKLYLILTHHHSDHTFGMKVFKEAGAFIISHKNLKEELKDDNGQYKAFIIKMENWSEEEGNEILGDVQLFPPDQVIEKDTVMNIDDSKIHILVTTGHESDELSVYHPASSTLFAGDTVYEGRAPHIKFGGPVEWKEWIRNLERLKHLKIDKILPGHGNICGTEVLDQNIKFVLDKVNTNQ